MKANAIHPAVRVGHVHLRVSDLDRAIGFYRDALGLGVTADGREAGLDAAFLAAGDYHHHVGLNTWASAGGPPADPAARGLRDFAIRFGDATERDRVTSQVAEAGYV
ncbi:MAG TPA: VOC family protein, partial [Microbacterium sp.]|uniref:VOC family protein n=1 Tax=Microbacterium sp. TaxID=51671 RepID=UPI002BDF4AC6